MVFKHPHTYGLMAMVNKKDYKILELYKDRLNPLVDFYMQTEYFDNIAPQHISLLYFSYPDKYPEEFINKLIPIINKIAKKYFPMKVRIKGLMSGEELGIDNRTILWNIIDFGEIYSLHKELIEALKEDIDHFKDPEIFTPHIGVALAKTGKMDEVKDIVAESKHDKIRELTLDRLDIFYPKGPKTIFQS